MNLQDELLAALAPGARPVFLELEELRNTLAAEREEASVVGGVASASQAARTVGAADEGPRWITKSTALPILGQDATGAA